MRVGADRPDIVSSLIAQGTEFPLRKPAGFHWDIFLLGLTTGVAGLLGIPFPNGLIPQAPFHTKALCVTSTITDPDESSESKSHPRRVTSHVVEQRVSNLAQGLLTLGTMTGPLLVVLHLIPQGVLAGLFFIMGVEALQENGITKKMLFLARDRSLTSPATEPLKRIRRKGAIYAFVGLELLGFGATFAITQTIAAIGFPIIILLLIPVRTFVLPRYFTAEELSLLDGPTASPFTMESVGGNFGETSPEDSDVEDSTETAPTPVNAGLDEPGDTCTLEQVERGEANTPLGSSPLGVGKYAPGSGVGSKGNQGGSYRRTSFRSQDPSGGPRIEDEIEMLPLGQGNNRLGMKGTGKTRDS